MWIINRDGGIVYGANNSVEGISITKNHDRWKEVVAWNAEQPTPLDLSDKPPEPPPVDADLERVKEIIAKRDDLITAGEVREAVLRFLRRNVR
jgi:hypothetical protein